MFSLAVYFCSAQANWRVQEGKGKELTKQIAAIYKLLELYSENMTPSCHDKNIKKILNYILTKMVESLKRNSIIIMS